MPLGIGCIVEGHGDCYAVPILVRRIAQAVDLSAAVEIPPPIRVPKSRLLKQNELERAVELGAMNAGPDGAVLILLDGDDDCPAELGPNLLARARAVRPKIPVAVVVANKEFESWFLAAADSLRGRRGLANDLEAPVQPEAIRGAKEWLAQRMNSGRYTATIDQPALAALFDLDVARRAPSFDKCYREVARFLEAFRPDDP